MSPASGSPARVAPLQREQRRPSNHCVLTAQPDRLAEHRSTARLGPLQQHVAPGLHPTADRGHVFDRVVGAGALLGQQRSEVDDGRLRASVQADVTGR